MAQKRSPRPKAAAPLQIQHDRQALWGRICGNQEAQTNRVTRLLQTIELAGCENDDLVPLPEVEKIMRDFTKVLVDSVPVQHHLAMHEAIEKSSKRLVDST